MASLFESSSSVQTTCMASVSAQAPGPEEVNWPTLWEGFRGRNIRSLLVAIPIGIMILFPIGIFAGAQRLAACLHAAAALTGIQQSTLPP